MTFIPTKYCPMCAVLRKGKEKAGEKILKQLEDACEGNPIAISKEKRQTKSINLIVGKKGYVSILLAEVNKFADMPTEQIQEKMNSRGYFSQLMSYLPTAELAQRQAAEYVLNKRFAFGGTG